MQTPLLLAEMLIFLCLFLASQSALELNDDLWKELYNVVEDEATKKAAPNIQTPKEVSNNLWVKQLSTH